MSDVAERTVASGGASVPRTPETVPPGTRTTRAPTTARRKKRRARKKKVFEEEEINRLVAEHKHGVYVYLMELPLGLTLHVQNEDCVSVLGSRGDDDGGGEEEEEEEEICAGTRAVQVGMTKAGIRGVQRRLQDHTCGWRPVLGYDLNKIKVPTETSGSLEDTLLLANPATRYDAFPHLLGLVQIDADPDDAETVKELESFVRALAGSALPKHFLHRLLRAFSIGMLRPDSPAADLEQVHKMMVERCSPTEFVLMPPTHFFRLKRFFAEFFHQHRREVGPDDLVAVVPQTHLVHPRTRLRAFDKTSPEEPVLQYRGKDNRAHQVSALIVLAEPFYED